MTQTAVQDTAAALAQRGHYVYEIAPFDRPTFFNDFEMYWRFLASMIARFGKLILNKKFDRTKLEIVTQKLARVMKGHWSQCVLHAFS